MKILIYYACYGGGHLSAAKAIKEELERQNQKQIEMIDFMKYLNKFINNLTVKSYEGMAKTAPKAWGRIYKLSRKGMIARISNSFNKIYAKKLQSQINEIKPDIIISTHPFSTQMCGILKKQGLLKVPVATIMTDFKYHEQWLEKHEYIEKFFVSNEQMGLDLITYGISAEKVFAYGLPISNKFFREFNKEKILRVFNLRGNTKTILFFAGGRMGLARRNIFTFLKKLKNDVPNIQVIAVSGKNPKIYQKFKKIALGSKNIEIIEFTDKVPELMSVSDLVITKPRRNNLPRSSCFSEHQSL